MINPPPTEKYVKLKQELIKRLSASREKKVHQLLMHEELGNRKPSQFLRHLQSLAGPAVPNDFLQTIWSSRLPSNIQTLIASQPASSLEEDIVSPLHQTGATSAPGPSMHSMALEIAELKDAVKSLTTQLNRWSHSREHSRDYSREHSRGRTREHSRRRLSSRSSSNYQRHPLCWYHFKFGANARKCITPCDFKSSGNA